MELHDIRADKYGLIFEHMKRDFPPAERPPFHALKRNFEKKAYEGLFLVEKTTGEETGYAVIAAPEGYRYAILLFFAILPSFRGKGYGGEFLKLLFKRYPEHVIILEVEDPYAAKTAELRETSHRRILFYERNGFKLLENVKAKIFGVDMLLMLNSAEAPESARDVMNSLYLPTLPSKKWLRSIEVSEPQRSEESDAACGKTHFGTSDVVPRGTPEEVFFLLKSSNSSSPISKNKNN